MYVRSIEPKEGDKKLNRIIMYIGHFMTKSQYGIG